MSEDKKMKFKILSLSAKEKSKEWILKIENTFGLFEAKSLYTVRVDIDDEYFEREIEGVESRIEKVKEKPDMFDDSKKAIVCFKKEIAKIQKQKAKFVDLVIEEFDVKVIIADFSKKMLVLEIPENVVPDIINIRHDVEAFVVYLNDN